MAYRDHRDQGATTCDQTHGVRVRPRDPLYRSRTRTHIGAVT